MCLIRQATSHDLNSLYEISLGTGDIGKDAAHLYVDPKLMGHIYSAPYLVLSPELAFVVERSQRVLGFCVGTKNTESFAALLEARWWPTLRKEYPKPSEISKSSWTADERRCQMIHAPEKAPEHISERFPGHLHINLLPDVQGRGIGRRFVETWMAQANLLGVPAVHVGVNEKNKAAISFWKAMGFQTLIAARSRTIWMGRQVA